jgi:uncharacterized PurR-regulated membrane protein YhhQ (DUF165 family)
LGSSMFSLLVRYKTSISYMFLVLIINIAYYYLPAMYWHGQSLSSADLIAGSVYLFRDFAQREIKHYVLLLMLVAAVFSYLLASPEIAEASICAFVVGEFFDWSIFTFLTQSLFARLLLSSCIAVPVDSVIFLKLIHQFNFAGFMVMNGSKWCGILLVFLYWFFRHDYGRNNSNIVVN